LRPIAELLQSQDARLRLQHPVRRQLVDTTLDVKAQLVVDRGHVHAAARQAQHSADSVDARHGDGNRVGSGGLEYAVDRLGVALPVGELAAKRAAPGRRELVVPGSALVLGDAPFAGHPAFALEAVKGRVEAPSSTRNILPLRSLIRRATV